jgi:hypothetical protein
MTRRRHWLALLGMLSMALAVPGRRLSAQSISLFISGLSADSTSPAPSMAVTGVGLPVGRGPYTVTIELSFEAQFRSPFYVNASDDPNASFHLDSLLPEQRTVYFRARAIDAAGVIVAQDLASHPVRSWLRLVDPARSTGTPLTTRKPRFVWSSPAITIPPGLWIYDIAVINSATGQIDLSASGIQDTSFVFPDSLQSSTSYRWQVHARTQNGPPSNQITVASAATFVITSADQPAFTLFYQNFPNPFGRAQSSASTCFWFDLAHAANVTLVIYDIRLREVRNIIPGPIGRGRLPVGAYGRQNVSAQTGCDDRLSWDGRDDTGRSVPPGVYLAVFKGDGVQTSKKILYKGP